MKRSFFSISSVGLLAAGLFFAAPSAMMAQSAEIVSTYTRIYRNNNVEVDLSKLAMKNSDNADVKKFAKQVIKDNHVMAGQIFSDSLTYGFTLTADTPSSAMDAEKQMKQLKGVDLDKMYLVQMDAFVKDDKIVAAQASALTKQSDLGQIGDQLQALVDSRTKDISQITQAEGFKIQ